jgi:hypothetical protein
MWVVCIDEIKCVCVCVCLCARARARIQKETWERAIQFGAQHIFQTYYLKFHTQT